MNARKELYKLEELQEKIASQETEELRRLKKEYEARKKALSKHMTTHYTKRSNHTTLCAGDDCTVKAVAKYRTVTDNKGIRALAVKLGATEEELAEFTQKVPQWAIG